MKENKPILVGGVGEINFGKQYRQGNRIYDSENIAMCLMSQPVGNTGGCSYLYKVQNKINNEGGNIIMKEFTNNLIKHNFDMEEIKLFDSFAGIGALHQSLKELGVPTKIVGMSEIEVDAIISYAAIHIDNFKDLPFEYPSEDEMKKLLMDKNIGYSFEKQKSSIPRLKKDKLHMVYKASVLMNNLGDISKLDYKNIPDFDLFNMSFPCTDISNAGKQTGMKKEDGTVTRSGLYIYGIEVIKAKKPKYIMIENVKGLIQKKFIDDFYGIIKEIEDLGYNCYYPTKEDKKGNKTPTCLNAKDFGIPQNRERIFVICVRSDINKNKFEFPVEKDYGIRLKDLLEDKVDEKYYLSQEIQDRFKLNGTKDIKHNELNVVGSSAPDFRTIGQRDMTYGINGIMSTLTATDYKQPKQIITNQIINVGQVSNEGSQSGKVYDSEGVFPTVCACTHGYAMGNITEKDNCEPKQIIDTNKLSEDGKTICEFRYDEGIRYFKDNICGSLRTIDSGGDKRIIETNTNKMIVKGNTVPSEHTAGRIFDTEGISPTVMYRHSKVVQIDDNNSNECIQVGNLETSYKQSGRVYNGICPTVMGNSHGKTSGGYNSPKILTDIQDDDKQPKISKPTNYLNNAIEKVIIKNNGKLPEGWDLYNKNPINSGVSKTLSCDCGHLGTAGCTAVTDEYRIRKLTPKECWRLMGFRDEHIDQAKELGISDSSLYKQAGNSIVVNVLYYIFKELFKDYIKQN